MSNGTNIIHKNIGCDALKMKQHSVQYEAAQQFNADIGQVQFDEQHSGWYLHHYAGYAGVELKFCRAEILSRHSWN